MVTSGRAAACRTSVIALMLLVILALRALVLLGSEPDGLSMAQAPGVDDAGEATGEGADGEADAAPAAPPASKAAEPEGVEPEESAQPAASSFMAPPAPAPPATDPASLVAEPLPPTAHPAAKVFGSGGDDPASISKVLGGEGPPIRIAEWGGGDGTLKVPAQLPMSRATVMAETPALPARCPRVYIYDLKAPFQDYFDKSPTEDFVFGPVAGPSRIYRHKNQYILAVLYWYRLKHSKDCYAADPAQADLFYIPLLMEPKDGHDWGYRCSKTAGANLREQLPYFNERTAPFHFFVVGKGMANIKDCEGTLRHPSTAFAKTAMVIYQPRFTPQDLHEHPDILEQLDGWGKIKLHTVGATDSPRVYVAPYPSTISWDGVSPKPWVVPRTRDILVSFCGRTSHGDTKVRRRIGVLCKQGLLCEKFGSVADNQKTKFRSTFCLEPIGDAIGRKSVADTIVMGCIPVFFGSASMYQYPEYWKGWHTAAFVVIDRLAFARNPRMLFQTLRNIPKAKVEEMQRALAKHGGTFQYNLRDFPSVPDALTLMLRRLWVDGLHLTGQQPKAG